MALTDSGFKANRNRARGIAFVMIGMAALSAQDVAVKWLSPRYPLHEIVFTRAAIATLLTLILVQFEGGLHQLRSRRPLLHLARGLLLVTANMTFFTALAALPLAECVAIFFVAPLIITVLSVPLLGEKIGKVRILAILAGFAGVLLITRPGFGDSGPVVFLPLIAAFCYALMQVTTRKLGATDKASVMAFYVQLSFVVFTVASGLVLGDGRYAGSDDPSIEFLLRAWVWPSGTVDWLLFLSCGVTITIGAYALSLAYGTCEATMIAPFEYTSLLMAVLWGLLLWGELPDALAFTGIGLIVGGGLLVFYREAAQGKALAAARQQPPEF